MSNCEICGIDPQTIVLLAKRQPDGRFNTFACPDCAIDSGMYCRKHQKPHMGFQDETTACIGCIEEKVEIEGTRIAGLFGGRMASSDKREEVEQEINKWYQLAIGLSRSVDLADLFLALRVKEATYAQNVSRLIIVKAERMNIEPEDVIEQVARMGSKIIFS